MKYLIAAPKYLDLICPNNINVKSILFLCFFICTGCLNDSTLPELNSSDEARLIYDESLKEIIENKCASCHHSDVSDLSYYGSFENVQFSINQIIKRIEDTTEMKMPPIETSSLTEGEKRIFQQFYEALYVESDEPNNEKQPLSIKWTTYKNADFDKRVAVSGSFNEISYHINNNKAKNILDKLKNAYVKINTSSVNIDGADGMRSLNVKNHFFAHLISSISATVVDYNEEKARINLKINNIGQTIEFDIKIEDNKIILTGTILDMNFFKWMKAYKQLDLMCGQYHENKIWQDIDLEVQFRLD